MISLRDPLESLLAAVRAAPVTAIDPTEASLALGMIEELAAALQGPATLSRNGSALLELPPEMLVDVLAQLPPPAMAAAAQTCRGARPLVEEALRMQEEQRVLKQHGAMLARHCPRFSDTAMPFPPHPFRPRAKGSALEMLCEALRSSSAGASPIICAGRTHTAFIDSAGRLLTCGGADNISDDEFNEWSQSAMLGLGDRASAPRPTPVPMKEPRTFVAAAVGPSCTLAVASTGEVYVCGSGDRDQLGCESKRDVRLLQPIPAFESYEDDGTGVMAEAAAAMRGEPAVRGRARDPIVAVACGRDHCLALSGAGAVSSWGVGIEGALGHGEHGGPPKKVPYAIAGLRTERVVAIAAGTHHSLALTARGVVFSWGSTDEGALGVGEVGGYNLHSPHPVERLMRLAREDGGRVVALAAGGATSVALTHSGALYAWGSNSYGQLGRGVGFAATRHSSRPARVLEPGGADPGEEDPGGEDPEEEDPEEEEGGAEKEIGAENPSDADVEAAAAAVGREATAPRAGEAARQERQRQRDRRDRRDRRARVRYRAVACGVAHCVAVSRDDGAVYAWGSCADGRLGLDLDELAALVQRQREEPGGHPSSRWLKPRGDVGGGGVDGQAPAAPMVVVPRKLGGLRDVVHVSAGWSHTVAATSDGRVFGWGDDSDHSLGLEAPGPLPVAYPSALAVPVGGAREMAQRE